MAKRQVAFAGTRADEAGLLRRGKVVDARAAQGGRPGGRPDGGQARIGVIDRATRLDVRGRRPMITLASGARVSSDAVMISVGVEYRRLTAPGVEELLGAGVFYGAAVSEAPAMRGQPVHVVGAPATRPARPRSTSRSTPST
jgi:hypothetical protein